MLHDAAEEGNAEGTAAPALERSMRAWRTVAVLTALYCMASIDRQMLSLLVTPIKADLKLSDVEISLLQGAAFALFFVLGSLPSGWLVDKVSRPFILFWGTAIWSLAATASGLAQGFVQLFAARAILGTGQASLQPAAFATMADLFAPARLALPLSIFVIGANLGSGISYIAGGLLVDWAQHSGRLVLPLAGELRPWQMVLVLTGLPGIALAFLALLIPRTRQRGPRTHHSGAAFADLARHYRAHPLFYLAHNLGFAMCMAFFMGLLAWNPAFLSRQYGWTPAESGLWLGGTQIATAVVGLLVHGSAVDRLFARGVRDAHLRYFVLASPLAGALTMSAYLVEDPWLMIGLFNLGLFCLMGYPSIGAASLQIATPAELRGRASAVYLIGLNLLGALLGPLIIASLTDFAFADEARLGSSMAIFSAGAMGIATVAFLTGAPAMRRLLSALPAR